MSYLIDSDASVSAVPEIALIQGSNASALTTSSKLDFDDNVTYVTYNGISSGLTVGTNTLTLGPGHWTLQAFIGLNNSDDLNNHVEYRWKVDGSLVGSTGASEVDRKNGVDSANASVTVDTGTVTAEINMTTVGGTCTVNSAYSPVVVWKVDL